MHQAEYETELYIPTGEFKTFTASFGRNTK